MYVTPYKDPFMVRPLPAVVVKASREEGEATVVKDLTVEFSTRIKKIEDMFQNTGHLVGGRFPYIGYLAKVVAFGYIQYKGANTELLNPKAFESSSPFGKGGLYNGKYFTAADFGNYAYRDAARSTGIDPYTAIQGAEAYALYTGSVTTWWNVAGCYDDVVDTEMILRGYFGF